MEIWLSDGVHDKLQLPINPQEIGYTHTRNFEDIILANGDEKTVISGKNLKPFTISSFFPKQRPTFAEINDILEPFEYVNKIVRWMDAKKVLLLQVTQTNIVYRVTIRSFDWKERGGAVGDIDYTLELKEYEPISYLNLTSTTTNSNASGAGNQPPKRPESSKPPVKSVTVTSNDTLWGISKKVYGTGDKWRTIYEANKTTIGKNPNVIKPGQKLVIP